MDNWLQATKWCKTFQRMDSWWATLQQTPPPNLVGLLKSQVSQLGQLGTNRTLSHRNQCSRCLRTLMPSKTHKTSIYTVLNRPTILMPPTTHRLVDKISWHQWWLQTLTSTRLSLTTPQTVWPTWTGVFNSLKVPTRYIQVSWGIASRVQAPSTTQLSLQA
jgi:hypothetical protein